MKRGKMKRGGPMPKANGLSQLYKLAAYGAVGLGAVASARAETVITFEGFTGNNTDINSIPGYGDNVSANSADYTVYAGRTGIIGTPDIDLDWVGIGWDTYIDWDGRGSVAQTDFGDGNLLSIMFMPSAISAVRVVSFQLDEWAGGGAGSIDWSLDGPISGRLAFGNWTMTDAGGRSGLFPDVTGAVGENISLNFKLAGGDPYYLALDNLTFDQVPEPSTWALGALGAVALGAAAMRRRRRA
jgi:hypothetical protein